MGGVWVTSTNCCKLAQASAIYREELGWTCNPNSLQFYGVSLLNGM